MAIPKIQGSQRDFSAGELDVSMKRADDNPIMKAGARQLSNWRIRNAKGVTNRPGRTALFIATGRTEEVTMSPGNTFKLVFGDDTLKVFDAAGAQVFTQAGMPWATATLGQIVWDIFQLKIYITFPGNIPQVLTWDGVATWSLANFAEMVIGPQKRTFFYRISPIGVTLLPSAQSGVGITLTASAAIFTAAHVGTLVRFINRQILITAVAAPPSLTATATVQESLPGSQVLTFTIDPANTYSIGDVLLGSVTGSKGIVTVINSGAKTITVQLTTTTAAVSGGGGAQPKAIRAFTINDSVVGPGGALTPSVAAAIGNPQAVTVWDDEVMNTMRGWPASVFVDQNRVGFCNFPSVPNGIGWSAIGSPTDLNVDATPDNAIFEIAPGKSRVLFVVAGPESSEFVFCDNACYYIPITATNPLIPGSVAFNLVSRDGCAAVQPRVVQELILWINAGLTSVLAIVAPGAYNRPYELRNLSELHSHLIRTPIAIAAPSTTAQFEERYAYVLNSDGTIAVGKYNIESGQIKGVVGWLPWSGAGTPQWIAALGSDVLFSASYAPNGITPVNIIELLDATQYLDGAMAVNAAPAAFAPPVGKGPLWWLAGGTVDLMDNVTRMMGTYTIDADGFIVPQNNGGENLLSAQLVAGQTWTATLEPFVADAPSGQDMRQRMTKRRVSRVAAYVVNSTGFLWARLFSGPLRPGGPALGAIINTRRVTTWNQGDDPTQPPPLREEVKRWRPLGRSFDPRVALIKDTPGPLEIPEIGIEASI